MAVESKAADQNDELNQREFVIQRIYTKDLSFEAPGTPEVFQIEWHPEVDLDLQTKNRKLADHIYEVVLQITVTAKNGGKVAFLVEIEQAGIFTLKGFADEQLGHMLGSFCPNVLFPYARELVSDLIGRGSFPPLYLSPINFDALYYEQLEKQQSAGSQATKEAESV